MKIIVVNAFRTIQLLQLLQLLLLVSIITQTNALEKLPLSRGTPALPEPAYNEPLFYLRDNQVVPINRTGTKADYYTNSNNDIAPRIINGNDVNPPQKYEFMALIYQQVGDEAYFICGGSLIAENVVLCAAHCADGASGVILGVHDMTAIGADGLEYESWNIEQIEVHPGYDGVGMFVYTCISNICTMVCVFTHVIATRTYTILIQFHQ